MTSPLTSASRLYHKGPPLGIVSNVFVLLFLGGLYPVTVFGGKPVFPAPYEPVNVITTFFQQRPSAVLLCAALHFGAAIPLGLVTATTVSRLRFLGVRAAGGDVALFGGFLTAFTMMVSASVLWAMTYPGVAQNAAALEALFRVQFALGGPGFSVPFGLLIAGVSVTAGFRGILPKWLVVSGIAIGAIGELSWFEILFPKLLPLIPLTRFPGFAWLIIAGLRLPRFVERRMDRSIEATL
jgi:hypothetical protein